MSDANNPINWIWPLPGEDDPPYAVESSFGPVSRNDSIVLTFTPATYTGVLDLYCSWQGGQQGITWKIYNNKGSPFTYSFNVTTPNSADLNDEHICHFFQPNNKGNTLTFQYQNNPSQTPVLWQQSGASAIVPSTSSGNNNTSPSSSGSGLPSTTATTIPASSSSAVITSSSHSLSVGAAVGITIGIVAIILALCAAAFFLCRRRRRRRRNMETQNTPVNPVYSNGARPMTAYTANAKYALGNTVAAGERGLYDGNNWPQENRVSVRKASELDGQGRSEMEGTHIARPPPAYPSEMATHRIAELSGD